MNVIAHGQNLTKGDFISILLVDFDVSNLSKEVAIVGDYRGKGVYEVVGSETVSFVRWAKSLSGFSKDRLDSVYVNDKDNWVLHSPHVLAYLKIHAHKCRQCAETFSGRIHECAHKN